MASKLPLLAVAARTASGNGSTFPVPKGTKALRLTLDVDDASGTTPTLDVVVEDTVDGVNFQTIGTAFTQKTAAGQQTLNFVRQVDIASPLLFGDQVRVRFTIGGTTPSFTFGVSGIALQ